MTTDATYALVPARRWRCCRPPRATARNRESDRAEAATGPARSDFRPPGDGPAEDTQSELGTGSWADYGHGESRTEGRPVSKSWRRLTPPSVLTTSGVLSIWAAAAATMSSIATLLTKRYPALALRLNESAGVAELKMPCDVSPRPKRFRSPCHYWPGRKHEIHNSGIHWKFCFSPGQ